MKTLYISAAVIALAATGQLSAAGAGDMLFARALNADGEPVGKLRLACTVGLGGLQAGGRHAQGNLEATPLVDDGMMYIADGWGSVYAIDLSSGKKGEIKWKFDPGVDRAWAGDVACCGVNNRGIALWKDKIISIAL